MPDRVSGDHFSTVSADYATFRPRYPSALFDFVASLPARRLRAWDCGAGTGQATVDLAEQFDEVVGTDVSAGQLSRAPRHRKVSWIVAVAEAAAIAGGTVDLVTVAQALHWFDHERFYGEVQRVAASGAAIAVWTYGAPRLDGMIGGVLRRFQREIVGPYWPPERKYVDDEYRNIPFPFERMETPRFSIEVRWTLPQLAGYLRTWSATIRFTNARGEDPVIAAESEMAALWGDLAVPKAIAWPVTLLAGRL